MQVRDGNLLPKGYQQITAPAAATALTVPDGARYALIKTETQAIRWRDDAVDPTAAIGMLVDIGDEFMYTGQLSKIKVIQAVAGAVVNVSYYA
jgi:hypothetical protein